MIYLENMKLFTNVENIALNDNSMIFICLYKLNYNNEFPYITYLLHKQTIQTNDICTFPYVHFNNNIQDTLKRVNNFIKYLPFKNIEFKGYLQKNNFVYFFYNYPIINNKIIEYNNETILYWTTIYEIIHMQSILNIPIHSTVFELFYLENNLIYLMEHGIRIEYPIIIYNKHTLIDIYSNYDRLTNCFKIKHYNNFKNNILRYILNPNINGFSKIINNKFYIKDIQNLQIISE